jgi:hypothetical protein
MDQVFNNIPSVAPITFPLRSSNELTAAGQKIMKYEPLLHQIAISFGFSNDESCELVQQAFRRAHESYAKQENCYPLKVFLTKCLIHKCIFKISSQLFSQSNTACIYSFNSLYTGDLRLQKMPLSLRTVYLLNIKFKYNELEMAEILNTTSVQVKEKLQKALAFIKTH